MALLETFPNLKLSKIFFFLNIIPQWSNTPCGSCGSVFKYVLFIKYSTASIHVFAQVASAGRLFSTNIFTFLHSSGFLSKDHWETKDD